MLSIGFPGSGTSINSGVRDVTGRLQPHRLLVIRAFCLWTIGFNAIFNPSLYFYKSRYADKYTEY